MIDRNNHVKLLDCTLRDGGYYNTWDFDPQLIEKYLEAMHAIGADIVELGFRFTENKGFKGAAAFASDMWLKTITHNLKLKIAVMLNASDLLTEAGSKDILAQLFPLHADQSPVEIVRIACHLHEYQAILPAVTWLSNRGYVVGLNLMQIAQHGDDDIRMFARIAAGFAIDVLYFADSTGSLRPQRTREIMQLLKTGWDGDIGIHAHDNLGLALENTLVAAAEGASWLDATVTGMGRGAGNTRTEELICELAKTRYRRPNLVPLMEVITQFFDPLKNTHKWGTNPYYYLAGQAGIHPSYIQAMLVDPKFTEADILAVIEVLTDGNYSKFSDEALGLAMNFFAEDTSGAWAPTTAFENQDVLLLGTGAGVRQYRSAVEAFIRTHDLKVVALNTQSDIDSDLIDFRTASHPVRMMADIENHKASRKTLIAPFSSLPNEISNAFANFPIRDFGMTVRTGFSFGSTACTTPSCIVFSYALALLTSGGARRIFMAGFDGYQTGDSRAVEIQNILTAYRRHSDTPLIAITPTKHDIEMISPFGRTSAA